MAKNEVISGAHVGRSIWKTEYGVKIGDINISKYNVDHYEILDEKQQKSVSRAVGRAAMGGLLLGPIGLFAGLSAKNKGTHLIALYFKDGSKSLLEVDDNYKKRILTALF